MPKRARSPLIAATAAAAATAAVEATAWGRLQEQRHQDNLRQFEDVRNEVRSKVGELSAKVDENTAITLGVAKQLTEKVIPTLEELAPVVTGVKRVRWTGRFAKGCTVAAGRFVKAFALLGSKIGQAVMFFVALGVLVLALVHGEGWPAAWQAFVKFITRVS